MMRAFLTGLLLAVLAGCAGPADPDMEPPVEMGDFRLGHVAVVVDGPEQGPFSRQSTDEELKAGLEEAIHARFDRYEGDRFYHIGVKLDLYALALPGVPIVFSPKSIYILSVSIWDDATQTVLSEEGGKALTVFEGVSRESVISSGLTQSKARQIAILSANTARAIQDFILQNPAWVGLPPLPPDDTAQN